MSLIDKMSSFRVLLLENIHRVASEILQSNGFHVKEICRSLDEEALISVIQQDHVQFLGIRSKTRVTRRVFESCPSLLSVGCFCIGTDQVDLDAAKEFNVQVFNAPYSNTRSVAELVICHIIALSRQVHDRNREIHRDGLWRKTSNDCFEIRGKTLGIVGYGNVGLQLSVLAEAIGMKVLYYDILQKLSVGNARPMQSIEELLTVSDFVSLHVPLTAETRNMIGMEEMSKMKRGSYLINTSRGQVLDLNALRTMIDANHLGGCAIDVYPEEPSDNGPHFESCVLRGARNTILTPHIGGSTQEAQESIGREVSRRWIDFSQ